MTGDLLDVVLVVAAVLFAMSGYRQGFVVGVLSFVGFLGGGVLGAKVAPDIAQSQLFSQFPRAIVGLAVVFLAASIGQVLATLVGGAVRNRLTWHPARQVDALGGAVISVISLLLISWLVGRAVASSPYPTLASQVHRSVVLTTVDRALPDTAIRFFNSFRDLIDEHDFPEVFEGLGRTRLPDVAPPNPALRASAAVEAAAPRILKITGVQEDCQKSVEGSGFVYAPERIMTNAHVVAGVNEPQVTVGDRKLDARVVLFDPETDVAVLAVPGLEREPLRFAAAQAKPDDDAIVAGYPQDGPFDVQPARVRGTLEATGEDIYSQRKVTRQIYALYSRVRQGNSGGPLLDPSGNVLGVIFAAAADDENVGYALTAREVADEAAAGARATQRVSTQSCS